MPSVVEHSEIDASGSVYVDPGPVNITNFADILAAPILYVIPTSDISVSC